MPTLPPLLNILLALTILTATTLTVLVITPPNSDSKTTSSTTTGTRTTETSTKRTKTPSAPPLQPKRPTETTTKDSIAVFTSPLFLNSCRLAVIGLGIHHAALAFFYPSPPQLICPRQEHLSLSLFTWSWRTSICLGGILIAAPVRLLAFKQLGPNFTFQLAVPGKLVTTGLYKFVQHPSYTSNVIVMLSNLYLIGRAEGVPSCWLACWVAHPEVVMAIWRTMWNVLIGAALVATWTRVEDEESMLKKRFGAEWEDWRRKTKRFIPWVF